jgi:hypothetical protein
MSKHPNPFSLLNAQTPDQLRAESRARWESDRVAHVLKTWKLSTSQRYAFERHCINQAGSRLYSFALFHEFYPTFPMRLGADNMDSLPQPLHLYQPAVLPFWLKAFQSLPFMDPWRALYDIYADEGKPVGLVFARHGFAQGLVIHNGDERFLPDQISCFMHRCKKPRQVLYVMPFHELLKQIGSSPLDWQPPIR